MIIDFHTHTFPDSIAAKVVAKLGKVSCVLPNTDGSIDGLIASMQKARVTYSINLPVMTSVEQVEKVNSSLIKRNESLRQNGIITFGGMHPDYPGYKQELKRLRENGIPGIKLHPAYQNIDLDDPRFLRIIECAQEYGMIILIHAGIDIGIYDHNYSSVAHILNVLKEVQPEKFVLAHMGNWACWDDVERYLTGAPVWFDTAFTVGSITSYPDVPRTPYDRTILSDSDFLRISRKHGVDRILFATDSPWQDQAGYIEHFKNMNMTPDEYRKIMGANAASLLKLQSSDSDTDHANYKI